MANNIAYNGSDKWKIKATQLLNSGGGLVDDVTVNGTSVVTNKVAEIDLTGYAESADLATVATSGSYTDLTDKPTIPSAQVNSDWNAASGVAEILNKPSIPSTAGDVGAYTTSEVDALVSTKQDSLIGGTISSGDLNTYTTIGHYYVNSTGASSVSHLPVALAGYLEVVQPSATSSGSRLQRYTAISSNAVVGVYERNYNSGAWQSWKQIGEDVYLPLTGGTLTGRLAVNGGISTNNASGFRSAIGINDAPSVIEDVKSSSQAVSVADTTHTTVLQISLTPGTWMVNATAIFAANATGYRQMYVTTSNTSTSSLNTMSATSSAVNGLLTALNTGRAVEISSNTTLYMRVRHSRGSALDVYGRLTAVKIINV